MPQMPQRKRSEKEETYYCSQMKKRKFEDPTQLQSVENQMKQISFQKDVVIYARCSTKAQDLANENHCSLLTQVGICTSFCEREGYKIVATETEIVSARHFVNQVKLLSIVKRFENCLLVVADTSRLSRDFFNAMIFLQECDARNIQIVSVREKLDSNKPFDRRKLIDNLQTAQEESDRISMRVRSSFEFRKSKGLLKLKTLYGEVDPTEKVVIEIIKMLYHGGKTTVIKKRMKEAMGLKSKRPGASLRCLVVQDHKIKTETPVEILYGNFNYGDIAHILNQEGILKRGNPWSSRTVGKVLNEYKDQVDRDMVSVTK
jgi:DNA invertase Pin-like site-specific DNA recombinase